MKILDPQSAVLTNSEVLSFMRSHPSRKPDPRVGGYPVTDLRGLWSVQSEFTDYTENITPHLLSYPEPPSKYMQILLQRLKKFNLTKPEVLVMINLGVGVKKSDEEAAEQIATQAHSGDEVEMIENGEGDLLDKVERHINSTERHGGTHAGNGQIDEGDVQMEDGQEENPDITILNTIIEEMYDRFNDADINEILRICGEVLSGTTIGFT